MPGSVEILTGLSGQLSPIGNLSGNITLSDRGKLSGNITLGGRPYGGDYTVTPSPETQVLNTAGNLLVQNITINPIPSNYGLITWDGLVLTVS